MHELKICQNFSSFFVQILYGATLLDYFLCKIKVCSRPGKLRNCSREQFYIAAGFVHAKAQSYVSNDCLSTYKQRIAAQAKFVEEFELVNTETAEVLQLSDVFKSNLSNQEIRRNELMTRLRGIEQQAEVLGFVGRMYTLTCPSKYHATTKQGHFNKKWQQFDPSEAQAWLCTTWAQIRASVKRKNINWFGMRIAEPHADGTPHFHILLFMHADVVAQADVRFISSAVSKSTVMYVRSESVY